jgi:hypothetical protein
MLDTTLQWFCETLEKEDASSDDFDRLEYYLEYYKNISPEGFDVSIQDDIIVISVPKT